MLVDQTPVDKMLGIAEVGKVSVIVELPDGLKKLCREVNGLGVRGCKEHERFPRIVVTLCPPLAVRSCFNVSQPVRVGSVMSLIL